MQKIVLASRNKKKLLELQQVLAGSGIELLSALDFPELEDVEESGSTFAANAALKAEYVCRTLGLPALADDSGLVVEALDGQPGVYSARFAGEGATDSDNNKLLLERLAGVDEAGRGACFKCVIAFARPDSETVFYEGEVAGRILTELEGEGGFGYDPLFYCPKLETTFARAGAEQKNRISHRGRAVAKFIKDIDSFLHR